MASNQYVNTSCPPEKLRRLAAVLQPQKPRAQESNRAAAIADAPLIELSVVIPCFNEEAVLESLRQRIVAACENVVPVSFEVILVDDGSTDRTRELIRKFNEKDSRIIGVFLSRNHGHQLALSAGLSVARGERCLIIDADLQDPPELLSDMMVLMDQGFDVVYGRRISREGESIFKTLSASIFYRLLRRMVDFDIPLDTGDFRIMSRRALDLLLAMPEQHRFIRGMVSWIGFRQAALPYEQNKRLSGETKYPLKKMIAFATDAITSFSIVPLRIAVWVGLGFALLSVPAGLYVLTSWILNNTVPRWTSVMTLLLMMGGIQMLIIGVLGEYLGRIYMQSKHRPLFIIEEVLCDPANICEAGSPALSDHNQKAPAVAWLADGLASGR